MCLVLVSFDLDPSSVNSKSASESHSYPSAKIGTVVLTVSPSRGAFIHVRHSLRWRDLNAVDGGGLRMQFRQTALLHLRHSLTMSRAHAPTLPEVIRPILPSRP